MKPFALSTSVRLILSMLGPRPNQDLSLSYEHPCIIIVRGEHRKQVRMQDVRKDAPAIQQGQKLRVATDGD